MKQEYEVGELYQSRYLMGLQKLNDENGVRVYKHQDRFLNADLTFEKANDKHRLVKIHNYNQGIDLERIVAEFVDNPNRRVG